MWGNPLPESCVGLFITLCKGWILKKRTKNTVFAQNCNKSKIPTKSLNSAPGPPALPGVGGMGAALSITACGETPHSDDGGARDKDQDADAEFGGDIN